MPDDSFWEEDFNPILRSFMYNNYIEDINDDYEKIKNHSYLIGSFINPEMVRKIYNKDANTIKYSAQSQEEFDKQADEFLKSLDQQDDSQQSVRKRKRKRKMING